MKRSTTASRQKVLSVGAVALNGRKKKSMLSQPDIFLHDRDTQKAYNEKMMLEYSYGIIEDWSELVEKLREVAK